MEAAQAVKEGGANPMKRLLAEEPELAAVAGQLDELLEGSRHVGRAPAQVQEFLASEVDPVLERHADLVGSRGHVYI
jgi:adenylosuccinate lyase